MQTVIIANEKMTQLFRDYKSMFIPFLKDDEIRFCDWNEEGPDLDTALPDLAKAVDGNNKWRAIIVNDPGRFEDADGNELFDEYNPYDYAENFHRKTPLIDDSPLPLIRLTHLLAGFPDLGICDIVEKPIEERANPDVVEYETKDYEDDIKRKHMALQIKYDELLWKPKDLWLISIRRKRNKLNKKDLKEIWSSKLETESSRFWQRNNYPEKCRFMCFDVADIRNEMYSKELFNFWSTVLTLSQNKIPASNLQAYRVYRIACEFDREEMQKELNHQYSRICQAKETVESALRVLPDQTFAPDEEILKLQNVPVLFENSDDNSSYVETKGIGLSKDCPRDELAAWQQDFKDAKKYLKQYVKEPRRAIDRAAEYTRAVEDNFYDTEYELDEIQLEEMQETIYQLEEDIMSAETMRVVDLDAYEEDMREIDKKIDLRITGRMTRKTTILAGVTAIVLFLISFMPYLVKSAQDGVTVFLKSIQVVSISALLFAAFGFVALLVFRHRVKRDEHSFNFLVTRIIGGINQAAQTFEEYLSLICTYMKAQSIVQGTKDSASSIKSHKALLRMHRYAIDETLDQIATWCAAFDLRLKREAISQTEEYYDYDRMPVDCPIYYMRTNNMEKNININTSGDLVTGPYEFISKLILEREEIYEKEDMKHA